MSDSFGSIMKRLRLRAGFSQRELGELLNRDNHYVSNREIGKVQGWTLAEVQEWAEACSAEATLVVASPGQTTLIIDENSESGAEARMLLQCWDRLTPPESEAIRALLRLASQR